MTADLVVKYLYVSNYECFSDYWLEAFSALVEFNLAYCMMNKVPIVAIISVWSACSIYQISNSYN